MSLSNLTARQINDLNMLTQKTKGMSFGSKIDAMIKAINGLDLSSAIYGTPVNAVNAGKVLTISGVVIDGETVTIGSDVYEFLADIALSKTAPANIVVDINEHTVKATNNLTMDTQPTAGDTITIGTKTYTFVPVGTATADGEISVGADLAAAKLALVAAINGTDGVNDPNSLASAGAFVENVSAITALVGGAAGNNIATTETFTAASNVFSAVKLATGSDCSAANAVTALVAAITASDTQGVGAVDGAGDTVELTADVAGIAGNSIAISETMANGAFAGGATALSGGVNGTVGEAGDMQYDASYLYICSSVNTISGKNWRRISLGSAY